MIKQVTDKMINTFTQAMLLSMPEIEDHYDQVKFGLEAVFDLASGNQEVAALKEANETWRKRWASERYEVEQLKAQVNCLLGYLKEISEYWNGDTNEIVMKDACYQALNVSQEALERIPEQCLAKVRAKAIEEYRQEQAEMKQMELATKLMVSSI